MHDQRLIFRDATAADAEYIGRNLRSADAIEAALLSDRPAVELVVESMQRSAFCRVSDVDGLPAMIFGVAPSEIPGLGMPWMVATEPFSKIAMGTARTCFAQIEEMHSHFRALVNQVHRDNAIAINWLQWLGFTVETTPTGPQGAFFSFWRVR